jgi:dynein heavy chain, axonemal
MTMCGLFRFNASVAIDQIAGQTVQVLDDNKKLCLNSGEIIQMSAPMNMIFEVMDLAVASPATVSRCGMVYMDASQVGWRPLILAWLARLPSHLPAELTTHLLGLFDWLLPVCLRFLRRELPEASPTLNGNLAVALHRTFSASAGHLLDPTSYAALPEATALLHTEALFLFALVWSIGGSVADVKSRVTFDKFLRAATSCRLHGTPLLTLSVSVTI